MSEEVGTYCYIYSEHIILECTVGDSIDKGFSLSGVIYTTDKKKSHQGPNGTECQSNLVLTISAQMIYWYM